METLAIQCFLNDYVYYENTEEKATVDQLLKKIDSDLTIGKQPTTLEILQLVCYRSFFDASWVSKLEVPDKLRQFKRCLIDEPQTEQKLMTSISTIEEVSDATSLKVKEQYEQNPYPKWVATVLRQEPITVEKYFRKNTAVTSLEEIARIKSPEILVAGCGTGQHSITAAKRFENCRVTAIDLSLSSLAYAIRKTEEMKIDNINHLQADILDLQYLKHSFDIIECVGVLHHMEDPMLGWKTLVRHLRPHGLMKIGLYSELARKDLTKIRDQIETTKKNPLTDEIRSARQKIIESRNGRP